MALLAGADLGGARGVLLLQSSGVGTCINMLLSQTGGDFRCWRSLACAAISAREILQYPMGRATQPALEAMGVICLRVDDPEEVLRVVGAALTMVYQAGHAVAVLFTQKLLGAKKF